MNRVQKQSIIIMINSIEQQLSALKGLLCMEVDEGQSMAKLVKEDVRRFSGSPLTTNEEEDSLIEKAIMVPDDERDIFMEDLLGEARKELLNESGRQ